MYKMSHKKLDKKEATQWTIRDYLKGFKQPQGTFQFLLFNLYVQWPKLITEFWHSPHAASSQWIVKLL